MKSRNVNEFPIATFSVDVFNGPRVLSTFATFAWLVLIPTKRQSVHNKNFIMALTIDLHRPLLALGVSVASLA